MEDLKDTNADLTEGGLVSEPTTGKLQEGGEGEDTDYDDSILQVRERVDSLTFNRFYVTY